MTTDLRTALEHCVIALTYARETQTWVEVEADKLDAALDLARAALAQPPGVPSEEAIAETIKQWRNCRVLSDHVALDQARAVHDLIAAAPRAPEPEAGWRSDEPPHDRWLVGWRQSGWLTRFRWSDGHDATFRAETGEVFIPDFWIDPPQDAAP